MVDIFSRFSAVTSIGFDTIGMSRSMHIFARLHWFLIYDVARNKAATCSEM